MIVSLYTVSYSESAPNSSYRRSATERVLARSVMDATGVVLKLHPRAEIWTVSHVGSVTLISPLAVAELGVNLGEPSCTETTKP